MYRIIQKLPLSIITNDPVEVYAASVSAVPLHFASILAVFRMFLAINVWTMANNSMQDVRMGLY